MTPWFILNNRFKTNDKDGIIKGLSIATCSPGQWFSIDLRTYMCHYSLGQSQSKNVFTNIALISMAFM
jgi:hypothetical protein